MKSGKKIIELEKKYIDFRRDIQLFPDIKPINLQDEKKVFIEKWEKKIPYNPKFKYEQSKNIKSLSKFKKFKKKFDELNHPLSKIYVEKIRNEIDWIEGFSNREKSNFPKWISSLYGKPNEAFVKEILKSKELNTRRTKSTKNTISAKETKKQILEALNNYGFPSWAVEITDMTARMSVNSLLKKVKINKVSKFSKEGIKSLIVHEIGSHVFRNMNGAAQPYQLFQFGFPNYLDTEEGLAIWNEKQNGLRDNNDEIRYRLRVLVAFFCYEMSFFELVYFANHYLKNPKKAFDMVARIKRGLVDTSVHGGYTKDQVYFTGYTRVKELPIETIQKLYIGKVGIDDLPMLEKMEELNWDFDLPDWLSN